MTNKTIRLADLEDLDNLARLFDAYRQFYKQFSDIPLAKHFLSERMTRNESVILIAENNDQHLVGFCQLYPTFCSVSAAKIATLYDLYVAPEARKSGVGKALLSTAAEYAKANGYKRLDLSTAHSNHTAQRLYESLGWQKDDIFWTYSLDIQ